MRMTGILKYHKLTCFKGQKGNQIKHIFMNYSVLTYPSGVREYRRGMESGMRGTNACPATTPLVCIGRG
jgi:hypothetical protein